MKDIRGLLNVWEMAGDRWSKVNIGTWVAIGIEIACGVLWIVDIVPMWGWLLSWFPVIGLLAASFTFGWITNRISEECDK